MHPLALVLCGIEAVILGLIWFGPLFGKPWMKSMGMSMPSAEERKKMGPVMMRSAIIAFFAAMITAFVLARAILIGEAAEGIHGVAAAFHFAFWNWIGFMAPVLLGAVLWEGKKMTWFWITAGYYLVNLLLMSWIISAVS